METSNTKKTSFARAAMGWLLPIVCAIIASILLTQVVLINAQIPTPSMVPTINVGDRVFGLRAAYWFSDPQRGDVIIFKFPDNEDEYYVKRIIGLPGDTVEITDGKVYINGAAEPLYEPYLAEPMLGTFPKYIVPAGCYFVMGDNRNQSSDSRFWQNTFVRRDQIIGKAWLKIYPTIQLVK